MNLNEVFLFVIVRFPRWQPRTHISRQLSPSLQSLRMSHVSDAMRPEKPGDVTLGHSRDWKFRYVNAVPPCDPLVGICCTHLRNFNCKWLHFFNKFAYHTTLWRSLIFFHVWAEYHLLLSNIHHMRINLLHWSALSFVLRWAAISHSGGLFLG